MKITELNPYHNIFFIGIGGISMSALSEILNREGKHVSGSDQNKSDLTDHLNSLGIHTFIGHHASHITKDIDLIVYTAAIKPDNKEYAKALELGIPMMDRASLLGHIMDAYPVSIGVAGTHGKTTTTSMLSHIMLAGNLDPTISVGAILKGIGGNFKIGSSDYFITEACEYSNSYHKFLPNISIILNIEEDHMDFFKDLDEIKASFKQYVGNTKEGGLLILNDSIKNMDYYTENLSASVVTVGHLDDSTYSYKNPSFDPEGHGSFDLFYQGDYVRRIDLRVTGYHNMENALASIAAGRFMGLDYDSIQKGLLAFGGADRRFEFIGKYNGADIIDDYAHHPTEIAKTLEAASKIDHNELWVVFQAHTYSRLIAFYDDFVNVLKDIPHLIITDIYPAREKNPGNIHAKMLVESLGKFNQEIVYFDDFDKIENFLAQKLVPKDMLITVGAGNVNSIGKALIKR